MSTTIRKRLFVFLTLAALGVWGLPGVMTGLRAEDQGHDDGDDGHKAKGEEVTLTGEIVDLHCFLLHPETGKGSEHAKCAKTCMNKGLPIGLFAEGRVYLLLSKGHDSVKGLAAEHAGHQVSVKGVRFQRHGMWALQAESVGKGAAKDHPKDDGDGDDDDHGGHGGHGGH